MIAISRYHLSLLLRSHRWIPAAVVYVIGVVGLGGIGGPSTFHGAALSQGLSWSALMLVPCVAWLSRAVLTAEPSAARACVAAAGGPRRAQLAALGAAAAFTAGFGVVGVIWELITFGVDRAPSTNSVLIGATLGDVGHGLVSALICLLVGSAIGATLQPAGDPAPGRQHADQHRRGRARAGLERVSGERRRAQRLRRDVEFMAARIAGDRGNRAAHSGLERFRPDCGAAERMTFGKRSEPGYADYAAVVP